MRTLVTGATGFLGRHLVPLLVERGDEVRALVREGSDDSAPRQAGAEVVRGSVLDRDATRRAASGCERVFHVAGLVAYERKDSDRLVRANVDSVASVAAALDDGARLVHVSSVAAVGPAPSPDRPADETQPFPEVARTLPYCATKFAGEQIALAAAADGADVVVANPAFVLGSGDVNLASTFIFKRYLDGSLRVHTRGGLSFVDAGDVAAGLVALGDRGRTGERYILANRDGNLSYERFFERVAAVTGVRRRMIGVPPRLAIASASVFRWPVGPGEARAGTHWWFYDPAKAERELGFTNRPLDETIAETAEYLRGAARTAV